MTKYNKETKMRLISLMETNRYSFSSAAKELNISDSVAKRWWKMYEAHGYEGLTMKSGSYSGDFKVNAVEYMHSNHLTIKEASAQLGIPSDTTLLKWERIYYEEGAAGLLTQRRGRQKKAMNDKIKRIPKKQLPKETEEDLIAEVQRLRAENAYLKKYNALVQEKKSLQVKKKQR